MTTTSPRPFGLNLMAALNIGFGIYSIAGASQLALALKLKLDPSNPPGFDPGIVMSLHALPMWFVVFALAASLVKAGLLFTSAWGYYNFKRVAGRYVAMAYAAVSLGDSAVALIGLPYPVTGGTFIGILYPVFTLLAVNTMWKPLLTR